MQSRTKDERFVIALYESLMKMNDFSIPQNRYEIGRMIGMNPTGVDTICKQLVRANFIKRVSDEEIILTEQGKRLVDSFNI